MTAPAEVIYFQKPCPHCKEPLFRARHMYEEWSECRNKKCPFLEGQEKYIHSVRGIVTERDPEPYTECYTRR